MKAQKKIIALFGPTASGKTGIAIELAQEFSNFAPYLISADSRQMYKYFTIGTAKPLGYPHFFTDFLDPKERYSAGQFKIDVATLITEKKGLPILVGGTPLYVSTITRDLEIPHVEPNHTLRAQLELLSLEELTSRLRSVDPGSLEFIDTHNQRRLIRALEVYFATGTPFSKLRATSHDPSYNILPLFLNPPLETLAQNIAARTKKILEQGFVQEVKDLAERFPEDCPAFSSIGYPEVLKTIKGELPAEQLEERIVHATLNYTKRQIVWFKKDPRAHEITSYVEAKQLVAQFLNN